MNGMSDFHSYAHAHEKYFKQYGRKVVYKKGQLLVRRDEDSPWMFFIEHGYVKMMFANENAEERIYGFGVPGMAITQSGSFFTLPHMELEFEAYGDCTVWRIARSTFMQALKTDTALLHDWYERTLQNNNLLTERILYAGEKNPRTRVIAWLLGMGRYYSLAQPDGSVQIEFPMTQDIMASFVYLSREKTNRIIGDLKEQRLIVVEHRIVTIPSIERLREALLLGV